MPDRLADDVAVVPSRIRAAARLPFFLLLTGVLLPIGIVVYPIGFCALRPVAKLWFKGVAVLCGLKIRVAGTTVATDKTTPGTLFVGNHVSYLDIIVLGNFLNSSFVAKEDVADWPLFGLCAKLYRTLFIKRDPREALRQRRLMADRLVLGDNLILFPEGTSTNGRHVLPFKSALFAAADASREGGSSPYVQPFSIAYTNDADGRPLDNGRQDFYAWYDDMTLLPHLLDVFGLKGAVVEVTFHQAVKSTDFPGRKDLSNHCLNVVAAGVDKAHGSTPR